METLPVLLKDGCGGGDSVTPITAAK